MKDEIDFLEKVDRYIDGKLPEAERVGLEKLCNENQEAKTLFEEHLQLRQLLDQQRDREKTEKAIEQAYQSWHKEQKTTTKPSRNLFLWKATAIAATLALLISIGNFWFSMSRYNQHKTKSYTILRREIDDIKRSQRDLLDDLQSSEKEPNPGRYGGTGFALSTNGYL